MFRRRFRLGEQLIHLLEDDQQSGQGAFDSFSRAQCEEFMKVLTLMRVKRLDELVPEPAAKLVALLSEGYGGFLMVHTSRLTHRGCDIAGMWLVGE